MISISLIRGPLFLSFFNYKEFITKHLSETDLLSISVTNGYHNGYYGLNGHNGLNDHHESNGHNGINNHNQVNGHNGHSKMNGHNGLNGYHNGYHSESSDSSINAK